MSIMISLGVISNILAILVLSIVLFYNLEQPKIKAAYGYIIAGSFLLYIISLIIIGAFGLIVKHNFYGIILLLCSISPFAIGKCVKYETLKKYTFIQIICFIISLVTLLFKF